MQRRQIGSSKSSIVVINPTPGSHTTPGLHTTLLASTTSDGLASQHSSLIPTGNGATTKTTTLLPNPGTTTAVNISTPTTSTTSNGHVVTKTKVETQYVSHRAVHHHTNGGGALSGGAIGGIVVGTLAGVVICLVLGWFLLRWRRRNRGLKSSGSGDPSVEEKRKTPEAGESDGSGGTAELHDKPMLFEARDGERYELPLPVAELEGDRDAKAARQTDRLELPNGRG